MPRDAHSCTSRLTSDWGARSPLKGEPHTRTLVGTDHKHIRQIAASANPTIRGRRERDAPASETVADDEFEGIAGPAPSASRVVPLPKQRPDCDT